METYFPILLKILMDWAFLVVCVEKGLEWRRAIARDISEMFIATPFQILLVSFARKVTRIMTH